MLSAVTECVSGLTDSVFTDRLVVSSQVDPDLSGTLWIPHCA